MVVLTLNKIHVCHVCWSCDNVMVGNSVHKMMLQWIKQRLLLTCSSDVKGSTCNQCWCDYKKEHFWWSRFRCWRFEVRPNCDKSLSPPYLSVTRLCFYLLLPFFPCNLKWVRVQVKAFVHANCTLRCPHLIWVVHSSVWRLFLKQQF